MKLTFSPSSLNVQKLDAILAASFYDPQLVLLRLFAQFSLPVGSNVTLLGRARFSRCLDARSRSRVVHRGGHCTEPTLVYYCLAGECVRPEKRGCGARKKRLGSGLEGHAHHMNVSFVRDRATSAPRWLPLSAK